MTDGSVTEVEFNLKIRATAEGGVQKIKDVKITVTVCGSESLSAVDPSSYTKTLDIGVSQPFNIDV